MENSNDHDTHKKRNTGDNDKDNGSHSSSTTSSSSSSNNNNNGNIEEGGELAWEGLGFRVAGLRKAQRLWSLQPTSKFCCLLIVGATVCCDWCF